MNSILLGWTFLIAPHASFVQNAPALDGRAAASYAYAHVFDASPNATIDRTSFVTQAMAAGGWTLPSFTTRSVSNFDAIANADALRRFLDTQKGVIAREIVPGSEAKGVTALPGDILVTDWGRGDERAQANSNRASGHASEFMVVQGSLGNGDFVYCRKGDLTRSRMGRFRELLDAPSFAQARYRLYHVVGSEPTHGLRENALCKDENQNDVYLQVNGGLFYVRDDETIKAFGGWSTLTTLPKHTLAPRSGVPVSGTMLRERNDVKVWIVDGRVRRYLQTDAAVRRYGGWEAVRIVPDGSLDDVFPKEGRIIP